MKIVWSPTAVHDLRHLRDYISQHNPKAAADVAQAILRAVGNLAEFPALGRPGRLPNTRELVVTGTPFIVPYAVRGDTIALLVVLHGARRWPGEGV